MKIFQVYGESFYVPGIASEFFATRDLANVKAAELTNILLQEMEMPEDATAENWQDRLLAVRTFRMEELGVEVDENSLADDPILEALGDDDGIVSITEQDVQGLSLTDWRIIDGETEEGGQPIDARPWPVKIEVEPGAIHFRAFHPDGPDKEREIWVEVSDHNLVAHCYDPAHEEPLNVRIGKSRIVTDHDRGHVNVGISHNDQSESLGDAVEELKAAASAILPDIQSEVEQRQTSGNDEYWADLDAKYQRLDAAVAAI